MNKLKYFILQIDYLISKAFLYSHSRSSDILKDVFYSKIYHLDLYFELIKGHINMSPDTKKLFHSYKELLDNAIPNRGDGPKLSTSIILDEVNIATKTAVDQNLAYIEKYLGSKFFVEKQALIRNFNFDNSFSNFDIYSNINHVDSHDGNRLLKVFMLIGDVDDDAGPLHYYHLKRVKESWSSFRERWSFKNFREIPTFTDVEKFTGQAGDFLIIDTSRHIHRAGIPNEFRDMLVLSLYPQWRPKENTVRYRDTLL